MRVVHDLAALRRDRPTVLTIGAFDGVHRGHQYLIRSVVERARAVEGDAMVISFVPRPLVVLRPGSGELSNAAEKERLIAALDPDMLALLPFTRETAQTSAGSFLGHLLDHVNVTELWTGADFAFGHNREGTIEYLIRAGKFAVHVVERQTLHGLELSSSRVRALLAEGDVRGAALLLGHYPSVPGVVVRGHGRGKGMGYPTANLAIEREQVVPGTGIYAAFVRLDGPSLPAAVSVGTNPTFEDDDGVVVEAFVLDFDADLRGRSVTFEFVERIRDERKFDSVDALVAAMGDDVVAARRILAAAAPTGEQLLEPVER